MQHVNAMQRDLCCCWTLSGKGAMLKCILSNWLSGHSRWAGIPIVNICSHGRMAGIPKVNVSGHGKEAGRIPTVHSCQFKDILDLVLRSLFLQLYCVLGGVRRWSPGGFKLETSSCSGLHTPAPTCVMLRQCRCMDRIVSCPLVLLVLSYHDYSCQTKVCFAPQEPLSDDFRCPSTLEQAVLGAMT